MARVQSIGIESSKSAQTLRRLKRRGSLIEALEPRLLFFTSDVLGGFSYTTASGSHTVSGYVKSGGTSQPTTIPTLTLTSLSTSSALVTGTHYTSLSVSALPFILVEGQNLTLTYNTHSQIVQVSS